MQIKNRTQKAFIASLLIVFVLLNLLIGVSLINWYHWLSVVQFLFLEVMNVGVAYGIVEVSFALLLKEDHNLIPRLDSLFTQPRVALLYTTCDDAMEEALSRLGQQSYPHTQVFVLDDSEQLTWMHTLKQTGFKIVRRNARTGFKAGSLNNWLNNFSESFDYFVVLDSDSILSPDFVHEMLLYAEHPANSKVTVLQSMVSTWNQHNSFALTISRWEPIWQYPFVKLANRLDTALSIGHNCLYRVNILRQVGGFCTDFIAEDYATSINLMRLGYQSRLVPTHSYEAAPMSIKSFTERNIRWAKQTMDLFRLDMSGIALTTQLHIFMNFYAFGIWLLYLPGMIISLFGIHTTFHDLTAIFSRLAAGQLTLSTLIPVAVLLSLYLYFILSKLPIALISRIHLKDYFYSLLVFMAMTAYILIPQATHLLIALLKRETMTFTITDKIDHMTSFKKLLTDHSGSGLFVVLLTATGIIYNPVAIVWNFPWIIPILFSPIILYFAHGNSGNRIPKAGSI